MKQFFFLQISTKFETIDENKKVHLLIIQVMYHHSFMNISLIHASWSIIYTLNHPPINPNSSITQPKPIYPSKDIYQSINISTKPILPSKPIYIYIYIYQPIHLFKYISINLSNPSTKPIHPSKHIYQHMTSTKLIHPPKSSQPAIFLNP